MFIFLNIGIIMNKRFQLFIKWKKIYLQLQVTAQTIELIHEYYTFASILYKIYSTNIGDL